MRPGPDNWGEGRSHHHGVEEVQQSRRGPVRGFIQF